jgi:hypothetical protein
MNVWFSPKGIPKGRTRETAIRPSFNAGATSAVGQQPRQESNTNCGHEQPHRSAHGGHQDALGQQLSHDAQSPRTQA